MILCKNSLKNMLIHLKRPTRIDDIQYYMFLFYFSKDHFFKWHTTFSVRIVADY